MSYYRTQLEDWLKTQDVKADCVIDIGGAQGNVKGRTKSWEVREYKVLDLPDFNIEEDAAIDEADTIFCLEVFEYLIDPVQALCNVNATLKREGNAFVTFAFAYPHHNELELDALRYTQPGIERLSKAAGLKIKNIWYRVDKSGLLQQFYAADGMHPAKEYEHHNVTGFIVEFVK